MAWPQDMLPQVLPERVVLVEKVVDALVEDEPVGVVHPVLRRREVEGRPVGFVPGAPSRPTPAGNLPVPRPASVP